MLNTSLSRRYIPIRYRVHPRTPLILAAGLEKRLKESEVRFRFMVQFRTNPEAMPLDEATVRWSEEASPPVHIADLVLPQQDISSRGQPSYGENLSWNIWRVTKEHTPQGSIADARRVVYAASADLRRNVNGISTGEPTETRPALESSSPCVDQSIVHAAIFPGIGIARIGDSATEYYIGPEVVDPPSEPPDYYRDSAGALKREAARFRIYGYNAAGEVVRELTGENADIKWTVHLANRKAEWVENVLAAGGCELEIRGVQYQLSSPTIVHDPSRRRFPIPVRAVLRLIGANDFMHLSTSQ
jgi:hypothetical protein